MAGSWPKRNVPHWWELLHAFIREQRADVAEGRMLHQDRLEERALVGEIVVEQPRGDPCCQRDIFIGRAHEAFAGKDAPRGGDDLLPPLLARGPRCYPRHDLTHPNFFIHQVINRAFCGRCQGLGLFARRQGQEQNRSG